MEWNEILKGLFPLGLLIGMVLAYFADKYDWKIKEFF